jgi:arginine N-succinyltransferase
MLRAVRDGDASAVWRLLSTAGSDLVGMTSLPGSAAEAELACKRSRETLADLATGSFDLADGEVRRLLLAVHEADRVVGLTGIAFKRAAPNLVVRVATSRDGQGLMMASRSEPWTRTELDSSYLGPTARGRGLGTLASRGRFLLLHLVASQIPSTVASHLRGRFDEAGHAPFWRCFGAAFAPWETSTAAEAALAHDPSRLDQLAGHRLPLTAEVLESMGPVNASSLPAFHLLMAEGLRPNGMYDPIDGGPTLVGELSRTCSGRLRVQARAAIQETVDAGGDRAADVGDPVDALVSVVGIDRFRAVRTRVVVGDGTTVAEGSVAIDRATAASLDVDHDRLLTVLPLDRSCP